jgi:hypothetical protein
LCSVWVSSLVSVLTLCVRAVLVLLPAPRVCVPASRVPCSLLHFRRGIPTSCRLSRDRLTIEECIVKHRAWLLHDHAADDSYFSKFATELVVKVRLCLHVQRH